MKLLEVKSISLAERTLNLLQTQEKAEGLSKNYPNLILKIISLCPLDR
jgi:hypothetical protein